MNDIIQTLRSDFPILQQPVHKNKPLVYLDNGATSQKPKQVIDAISTYYAAQNSNVHRGAHYLSALATEAYESARVSAKEFINANSVEEINFVRGTTEGINLVASCYGESICAGDEIIISALEHHSNIVPWQMLCERKQAILKVIPINKKGELDMEAYKQLLSSNTKLVSVGYISNSLGTINPVQQIIQMAHAVGAVTFIDAAQAAPHLFMDVQALDTDFLAFSAHKMFGPTGIGILYGKKELLEKMPPYHGGGEMIKEVTFEKTTYNDLPYKFEAGTPNIAGAAGLKAAIDYIHAVGYDVIQEQEQKLLAYATEQLQLIDGAVLYGTSNQKASVLSFLIEGVHSYDIGTLLDQQGIAIRTGHHCCQPLMGCLGIEGTCRASFAFYNTLEEVDAFIVALRKALSILKK